jgi:hypothetical protein
MKEPSDLRQDFQDEKDEKDEKKEGRRNWRVNALSSGCHLFGKC